jgi:hypothetical protein
MEEKSSQKMILKIFLSPLKLLSSKMVVKVPCAKILLLTLCSLLNNVMMKKWRKMNVSNIRLMLLILVAMKCRRW